MEIATGILVANSVVSAIKNLYELTFMVGDDPVKEKKLKYRTNKFDRSGKTKQYLLTIEGNRIIDIEPMD